MTSLLGAFRLSKEEVKLAKPPGTSTLVEHLEWTASQQGHDEIRLVPQPSADPMDPLNLPWWQKMAMLITLSIHPFVVNVTASSMGSALPVYAAAPVFGPIPVPFARLGYLIAVNVLLIGVSNLFWVPLANTFGRRNINLISLAILIVSSAWAGLATSFNSLLAARAIMGIGAGPADAVTPDVLGEIFFIHQRGRAMAVYTMALTLGAGGGGLFGGYIAFNLGLSWIHWINVIICSVTFVLVLLFQAETLYDRHQTTIEVPRGDADDTDKPEVDRKEIIVLAESAPPSSYQPYSYMRSLKLWTYRPGLGHRLMSPYKVARYPGVWLVTLWYSGLVGLVVTMSTIGPSLLAAPPYLWGKNIGLVNIGAIVGAILGAAYTYLVTDWSTKRAAQKDRDGFAEPETRLISALPALFLATAGALVYGFVGQNPSRLGWVGLNVGLGMVNFGLAQVPSVGFNYVMESYSSQAGDCFVFITFARGIVAFAFSFFVGDWVAMSGVAEPFGIFAMLMGVFSLLTIPVILYGKRLRLWTAKWVPEGTAM
ncbi:MFS transporter-like protein [Dothidotthia symphoricarpi CBS 119687]|uniref:MFS transporter-like protein n=1 Tax=Dothidotthia symphoricarpi CBS 119687 TaxID=1392245 RepID=A0A6A6ALV0_9PLEO|nr:MFS transporter-like protein [Dothidotthia symphoricarpi CBS 119687]KAF2132055.1 MFS transporter-like protein [Dothidotthia symphoricarpi CBS 119687]